MEKFILNVSGPWEFREFPETARRMSDLDEGRWLKTDCPQSIYLSLAQAGILTMEDLYAQPAIFTWIGRQAWVFRTRFNLPQEYFLARRKELIFEGLDTVTQIWLNDKLLGRTHNMFMAHRFDADSLIRPGENSLVIQFVPAHEYANKIMKRFGKIGAASDSIPRPYLRKAQFQFGSVLGPQLVNCGITGPVRLESAQTADIADIHLRTIDCNESFADIVAAITLRPMNLDSNNDLKCLLRIQGNGPIVSCTLDFRDCQEQLSTVLRLERPVLWQPHGYGTPFLYQVQVQLYNGEILLDEKKIPFGIRNTRVLRQPNESAPAVLEINQQSFQIKGVSWIPLGLLRDTDERNRKKLLLSKLVDANINMLSVWAGGGYEDDYFYELCDELGILVWQETMPPPLQSPDAGPLLKDFESEMEQTVRRLRNHPCLIGWGDGFFNSNQAKLSDKSGKQNDGNSFYKNITELLNEWDPDRDCIFTLFDKKQNNPVGSTAWLDTQDMSQPLPQNTPQAMPCINTLQMTCRDEEIFPGSIRIESQSYFPSSYAALGRAESLFAPPKTIEEQIYQSQVAQGRWAKKRIEACRSESDSWPQIMPWTAGQYWPGAGFSMVDFTLRPNAIYYYTRRSFAPVMACLVKKKDSPQTTDAPSSPEAALIINDRPEPLAGKIIFELMDMKGQSLDKAEFPVFTGPYSKSNHILPPRAFTHPMFPDKSLLRLAVIVNDQTMHENIYLYLPDKYIAYKPMEIDLILRPVSERQILLGLKSRFFVKDLEIIGPQNARTEDNFIDLLPGRDYEITAHFDEPILKLNTPWFLRSISAMS